MDLNNKRILLTGGCGFIGTSFVELLIERGITSFVVVDKISYCSDKYMVKKHNIPLLDWDINSEETKKFIEFYKPHIIMHLAASSHVDNSIKDPEIFRRDNVDGTLSLLNVAKELPNLELFYHCSTDEVLGDKLEGFSKEDDPRICSSPYSASKGAAELFVEAYGRTYGLPYIITRSSNNYGP